MTSGDMERRREVNARVLRTAAEIFLV